jgi:hypothetical protein
MFSSPVSPEPRGAASPTNRFPFPRPFHSNRCHPACPERSPRERSEGSAFLFSPIRALSVFLASPLFSYSCAHFCHNENDNLFAFRRFHTLCSKHPGWGPAIVNFLVAQISDLPVLPVTSHKSPVTASALFLPPVTNHPSQVTKPCRIHTSAKRARNSRRIRTSKTQDLKPFGMNTYRKTGEGEGHIPPARVFSGPFGFLLAPCDRCPNLSSRAHRGICFFTVRRQLASHYSLPTTHYQLLTSTSPRNRTQERIVTRGGHEK